MAAKSKFCYFSDPTNVLHLYSLTDEGYTRLDFKSPA